MTGNSNFGLVFPIIANYGTFKAFLKLCLSTSMEGVGAIGRMRDTGDVVKRFQRILTSRKQIKQPS